VAHHPQLNTLWWLVAVGVVVLLMVLVEALAVF